MFQSFTGNSRRPRQVNLSGRSNNPFATTSGVGQHNTSLNSQNAVVQAQQERLARQQERERLYGAKLLQRVWRGHASRKELQRQYRAQWDNIEDFNLSKRGIHLNMGKESYGYTSKEEASGQLQLLVRFASPTDTSDARRVQHFSRRLHSFLASSCFDLDHEWSRALVNLAMISASMLRKQPAATSSLPSDVKNELLKLLSMAARMVPHQMASNSYVFYSTLGEIVRQSRPGISSELDIGTFEEFTLALLVPATADSNDAYESLASELLTVPDLQGFLGSLNRMAARVNRKLLCLSMKKMLLTDIDRKLVKGKQREELLWLLSHFIYVYSSLNSTSEKAPDADYIFVLSSLLSFLAEDIASRVDRSDLSSAKSLPTFVQAEILTLVDQGNVTSLLAHLSLVFNPEKQYQNASEHTATLATFALTLLRVFPRRADDVRMWLYLGSTTRGVSSENRSITRIPAIKYFWAAVTKTHVYSSIYQHPQNAVELLRGDRATQKAKQSVSNGDIEKEWRVILLFLELYTFVLKVTVDEEFMSGSVATDENQSWTRQSALALEQVRNLTVFLKNLAFAMYWNGTQILGSGEQPNTSSLGNYFGTAITAPSAGVNNELATKTEDATVEALSGTSLTYMKGMVTGLLRMIYERDSRRNFLAKDHWLMTEHFDMGGFIPAVVMEEDVRHHVQEADDMDDDNDGKDSNDDPRDEDVLVGARRTRQVRRNEQLRNQQRKTARKKHLESVTPRLEILQNMPFFIPFATRVEIFREFVTLDQTRRRGGFLDPDQWRMSVMQNTPASHNSDGRHALAKHHAKVRRENVFDDALAQFYELGDGLKEPIQITFVDQFDTVEAGIDGGGVTKEFLTSVTNEAFSSTTDLNLFTESDVNLLYPNPSAVEERKDFLRQVGFKEGSSEWNEPIRDLLRRYEFLGRVIGKCLYEGILVDIHFAPFFLVKWALTGGSGSAPNETSYRANINDLRDLDEGLYQGLLKLKDYPGDVEDFGLDFTITDTISSPAHAGHSAISPSQRIVTRDLRPGGSQIPVTNENRLIYISCVAKHRLQSQPYQQTSAFLRGLGLMIQPSWLSMFNQSELQTLLGGDSSGIDIVDLRKNTQYGGVYVIGNDGQEHPTVQMFWEVMHTLADEDCRKLLKYVTSTPRGPLLGFKQLNPQFSIRDSGSDQTRLPSTSTCVNLLKLPIYQNVSILREKLLYAINAGAGFNLS